MALINVPLIIITDTYLHLGIHLISTNSYSVVLGKCRGSVAEGYDQHRWQTAVLRNDRQRQPPASNELSRFSTLDVFSRS